MYDYFETAAFKDYIRKLIWQAAVRKIILLQASIDTDLSSKTWEMLEFIARELDEKETSAT